MKMNKLLLICLAVTAFSSVIRAQATIGSGREPREGDLLDLKENSKNGKEANASKGLGLPRVALTALNTLTVDDDAKGNDYVGLTVYNTNNDAAVKEGTYCWVGDRWKQVLMVNTKGSDGNVLQSNGDGTYDWSEITIPSYEYSKPTQVITFDPAKANANLIYSYKEIVAKEEGSYLFKSQEGLFNDDFAYTDILHVKSGKGTIKYMLLGATVMNKLKTRSNAAPPKSYWGQVRVKVLIDGKLHKNDLRTVTTTQNGNPTSYIDLFSVIVIDGSIGEGDHILQIKVSVDQSIYAYNAGGSNGNFDTNASDFCTLQLTDIGLVLYENY